MATLYIAEAEKLAILSGRIGNEAQAIQVPPITEQVLAISAGSVQSAAFNGRTKYIRVHCDAICSIAFGDDPVAAATNMRLAANQTETFGVLPGQKIAVITNI